MTRTAALFATILLTLLMALCPGPLRAGAWPRAVGEVFTAISTEMDRDDNRYTGFYGEYGLTPRTTLGVEVGHSNVGQTSALIWVQRSLDNGEGPHRFSTAFGAGIVRRDGATLPLTQSVVSWGRGFQAQGNDHGILSVWGDGWLSARGVVQVAGRMDTTRASRSQTEVAFLTPETAIKAELTLGLRPTDRVMVINELRLEDRRDVDFSVKVASSVVVRVVGPLQLELGMIQPVRGPGERAIKLGSWVAF